MRSKDPARKEVILDYVNAYYIENQHSPSIREIEYATRIPRSTIQRYLIAMAEDGMIDYDGKSIRTPDMKPVALETTSAGILGSIPCGYMTMAEESVEEYVNLPAKLFGTGKYYLLHANEDSMIKAGIDDGDLVLIRQQEEALDGEIIAAYVEGEGNTLKRLYRRDGYAVLQAANPKYADIIVRDLKIQGVAVWVFKQLKAFFPDSPERA